MKLSILIPSLPQRAHLLRRLIDVLQPQGVRFRNIYEPARGEVEAVVYVDSTTLISDKRNELLKDAKGQYIAFVDDDDLVPEYYVSELLNAINEKPDCIGFRGYMTTNGNNRRNFIISNRYANWHEANGEYLRTINHLSPVKRSIALKVMFPEKTRTGEDSIYSQMLKKHLKKEVFIDKDMYHYDFQTSISSQCN